jgi:hypothetical protein
MLHQRLAFIACVASRRMPIQRTGPGVGAEELVSLKAQGVV